MPELEIKLQIQKTEKSGGHNVSYCKIKKVEKPEEEKAKVGCFFFF